MWSRLIRPTLRQRHKVSFTFVTCVVLVLCTTLWLDILLFWKLLKTHQWTSASDRLTCIFIIKDTLCTVAGNSCCSKDSLETRLRINAQLKIVPDKCVVYLTIAKNYGAQMFRDITEPLYLWAAFLWVASWEGSGSKLWETGYRAVSFGLFVGFTRLLTIIE